MSASIIHWPPALGQPTIRSGSAWTEYTGHFQTLLNVAGYKFANRVHFSGDELDYIELALGAGTQADNINLSIQAPDSTWDTLYLTGVPDGTAIANSSVDVSDKGGTKEWVRFTFGATGPSPSGLHWVVIYPTSSGSFSIKGIQCGDWHNYATLGNLGLKYNNSHWANAATLGSIAMRIKKKDGDFLPNSYLQHCPFTSIDDTIGYPRINSYDDCYGVKFVAPFDMELIGFRGAVGHDAYSYAGLALIDSSDTVLRRSSPVTGTYLGNVAYPQETLFEPVSLTQGSSYRLYLYNPQADGNRFRPYWTIQGADYSLIGLTSGEWSETWADDPPSEGGTGTWTTTDDTIVPWQLICMQNPDDLAGGGGGGGVQRAYAF